MSNRIWALIGNDYVCQKDAMTIFTVNSNDIVKLFPTFDSFNNNAKFIALYGLKQNLQDKQSGESTPATMKARLEAILNNVSCKIRTTFEASKGGNVTLAGALKLAKEKRGHELSEAEVNDVTTKFNAYIESLG